MHEYAQKEPATLHEPQSEKIDDHVDTKWSGRALASKQVPSQEGIAKPKQRSYSRLAEAQVTNAGRPACNLRHEQCLRPMRLAAARRIRSRHPIRLSRKASINRAAVVKSTYTLLL